jgi:hypothetical protein
VNDVHAAVNLNDWTPDDDPPIVILIIVVRTALVNISPAAVFLGLAWRQSAISPSGFLTVTPSRRALVAVTITAIFVSVAALPTLIVVIIEVLVPVLELVSLVPVICHQRWRAHA